MIRRKRHPLCLHAVQTEQQKNESEAAREQNEFNDVRATAVRERMDHPTVP